MSDASTRPGTDGRPIRVLQVGGDPEPADAGALERAADRLVVEAVPGAEAGLERLADGIFDCVVSGYDLPGRDGVEFLETVRRNHPDLPFVLFTGEGSEAVAGAAVSAGATAYVRDGPEPGGYETVADRVREAVEDRRRSERAGLPDPRSERIYERITDGFLAVGTDWRYTYANEAAADLLGRSLEDLRGTTVWEAFPGLVGTPFEDALRTAMETRETTTVEARFPSNDRWYDVRIYPDEAGLSIFFRDVTDRKQRRRRLERSERRYRTLAENLPQGAVLVFDDELTYRFAHGQGFEETAAEPSDYVGNHVTEAFDGEVLAVKRALYEGTLAGNRLRTTMEFRGRTYRVHTVPVRDESGEVYAGLVMTQDVSAREDRERALQRERDRLERFAGVLSHDLRTPLAVARGRLELAAEEHETDHLDAAREAVDRMDDIVEDVLWLARDGREVGGTAPVPLRTAVEDAWRLVADGREAAALLWDDEAADLPTIAADRGRLDRLLENLLGNALEHAGPGVTVTVGELAEEPGFYLADDGPGIPEGDRETVFDPGFSTAEAGTGLGLAIVERIADAHGWTVRVTDGRAGGARFEIAGIERAE